MEITEAIHTGTEQVWQDEKTVYWYDMVFDGVDTVEYGIVDQNGCLSVIDEEGFPVDTNDHLETMIIFAFVEDSNHDS